MENNIVTLNEVIPPMQLLYDATPGVGWYPSMTSSNTNGWFDASILPNGGSAFTTGLIWCFQTTLDVSGWGNQGLTFYPLQAGVQEGYMFTYINDDILQVIDIISDSPLDVTQFAEQNLLQLPQKTVPGLYEKQKGDQSFTEFPPLGFENVLYGNSRNMGYNSNFPFAGGVPFVMPVNQNDFGSMNPTATDKLYVTRILVNNNASRTVGYMNCPPSRFIIKGQLMKESDLSYIYRLKDSFKTQQTDVGYGGSL